MTLSAHTFEAPEFWASYLLNGDSSGLSDTDLKQVESYLEAELPEGASIVSCADEGRFTWSYRLYGGDANGGSVLEYTYLIPA